MPVIRADMVRYDISIKHGKVGVVSTLPFYMHCSIHISLRSRRFYGLGFMGEGNYGERNEKDA